MEARFTEQDARIARLEQTVINLSNAFDRRDSGVTQNAQILRRARLRKQANESDQPATLRAVADDSEIEEPGEFPEG